ncbi:MAG: site-specific DNA-methyltransferase [Thermoplasmata archaeon]|nr:site-specific DNA-methyltransferase [Thermoplasmata archaeon]
MKSFALRPDVRVLQANFLRTRAIPAESVDLIVTSPPYNVNLDYGAYHDDQTWEQYLRFSGAWLAKCFRLAKSKGRLCLNVPLDKNKGGQQSVAADLTELMKRAGWKYQSTIIWNEQNISRRTAWGSWLSASAPFVIAPVEVVIVGYKDEWKRRESGRQSDIARDEFIAWTNAVWTFSGENGRRIGHPSPFPVELPLRLIKLFSYVGDTVLDPFLGSGSTLVACARSGRKGVGVELDPDYCAIAVARIRQEGHVDSDGSR